MSQEFNTFGFTCSSAKEKNDMLETGAGGGETTQSLITSASPGRVRGAQWPSEKPWSKKGLNEGYKHTEQRPCLLICFFIYSPVVPPRLIQYTFPLVFWCGQSKLNWDPSLLTGSHHVHIRQASLSGTTGRGSVSSKLQKEAHLDTESSKVIEDKSCSFIFQRGKKKVTQRKFKFY